MEDEHRFQALRNEHLPGARGWGPFDEWKAQVEDLGPRLLESMAWVKEQPGENRIRGLSEEESVRSSEGLTKNFARTVVLNAVEDAYYYQAPAALALIIRLPMDGSLAQNGISPHFIILGSFPSPALTTVRTSCVGAMLYLGLSCSGT